MIGTGIGLGLSGYKLPTARDSLDPTLALDLPFADTGSLTAAVGPTPTFTRASAAWYFNSAGIMQQAAINQPRFGYVWNQNTSAWIQCGLIIEGQVTNYCLWNRDLTNPVWTASGMTVAKDQVGLDGVANSASRITANTANATILQTNSGSTTAYFMFYVRRISGSGNLAITANGGTSWVTVANTIGSMWIPSPLNTSGSAGCVVGITMAAGAVFGFQVQSSGDSFAIDCVSATAATSAGAANCPVLFPIPTTSSAVVKSAEAVTVTLPSGLNFPLSTVIKTTSGKIISTNITTNTFTLSDGSPAYFPNNGLSYRFESLRPSNLRIINAGLNQQLSGFSSAIFESPLSFGARIKTNDMMHRIYSPQYGSIRSASSLTISAPSVPVNTISIGPVPSASLGTTDTFMQMIHRIRLWNVEKTDSELDSLILQ